LAQSTGAGAMQATSLLYYPLRSASDFSQRLEAGCVNRSSAESAYARHGAVTALARGRR
jgi:hypothetical protein